jgi:glycosyltransferase involved in cell wall biosynthesis
MGRLVQDRLGNEPIVIPNAVDRSVFTTDVNEPPRYLTYEGGGSPWQGLDHLCAIWQALHAADPSLRFRVITRDERARVLTAGINADAVELVSTDDHHQVATLLRQARLGFLVRESHLVNQVAWPMKLGEYLAAGSPVVVSRSGWDAERVIERHGAGLLVEWDDPPEVTARRIAAYLNEIGPDRPAGVAAAADELDAVRWHSSLVEELEMIESKSSGR